MLSRYQFTKIDVWKSNRIVKGKSYRRLHARRCFGRGRSVQEVAAPARGGSPWLRGAEQDHGAAGGRDECASQNFHDLLMDLDEWKVDMKKVMLMTEGQCWITFKTTVIQFLRETCK